MQITEVAPTPQKIGILVAPIASNPSEAVSSSVIDLDKNMPAHFGRGYDSLRAQFRTDAVVPSVGSTIKSVTHSKAQTIHCSLQRIENHSQLRGALKIPAGASCSHLLGNTSAKNKYAQQIGVNEYSLYIVAHIHVVHSTATLTTPVLTGEAKIRLARNPRPTECLNCFGDGFVSSIATGGEMFGVLEIAAKNAAEQESFATELSGIMGDWPSAGEMTNSLVRLSKRTLARLTVYRHGGSGPVPTNLEELIAAVENLPQQAQKPEASVPLRATLQSYAGIPGLPPACVVHVERQNEAMNRLANDHDAVALQQANWEFIRKNPLQFKKEAGHKASAASTALGVLLTSIESRAKQILEKPFAALPEIKTVIGLNLIAPPRILPVQLAITTGVVDKGNSAWHEGNWAGSRMKTTTSSTSTASTR